MKDRKKEEDEDGKGAYALVKALVKRGLGKKKDSNKKGSIADKINFGNKN